jgi:N-dimethylarginine dimethylaminohydrolase
MIKKRNAGFAAYHAGSWKYRTASHREECAKRKHWPFAGLNSEFKKLKAVLLYSPPLKPLNIKNPEKVQHLRKLNWKQLRHELAALEKIFISRGVKVHRMKGDWFTPTKPNLMFARDQFFMTPWGAVLGRMASPVRAGEEKWAQKALADLGIPILHFVGGRGTFEGADALWLSPRTVLIGTGNRTNRAAHLQITKVLKEFNVRAIAIPLPRKVQHLLGLLQIVDRQLALVRTEIAHPKLIQTLNAHKFQIIPVAESAEVTERQGMNVVVFEPRRIIMPTDCPGLKALYREAGLKVLAEAPISQLLNAAGGIACTVGMLARVHCLETSSRV